MPRLLALLFSFFFVILSSVQAQSVFAFGGTDATVGEVGGASGFQITRTGDTTVAATVHVVFGVPAVLNGTSAATYGDDYSSSLGQISDVTFDAGETSKVIPVTIIDDTLSEATEQFQITLSASGNNSVSDQSKFLVTISDNEPSAGTFKFSQFTADVDSGSTLTLTVNRTDGSFGTATVEWSTSGGFARKSGTLTFADGVTSQSFDIAIPEEAAGSANYEVDISLGNPTGGTNLGVPTFVAATVHVPVAPESYLAQTAGFSGLLGADDLAHGYGSIAVNITSTGKLTGKLVLNGGAPTVLKGTINSSGVYSQNISVKKGAVAVTKSVSLKFGTTQVTGTFDDGSGRPVRNITGERNLIVAKKTSAAATGYYTFRLFNTSLAGVGFRAPGTVTVLKTGKVTYKGTLPDGTKVSQGATLSASGSFFISIPLYKKNSLGEYPGYFQGTAVAGFNNSSRGFSGDLFWTKPASVAPAPGELYKTGVSLVDCQLQAQPYVKPAAQHRALSTLDTSNGNALLAIRGGDLAAEINHAATVDASNHLSVTAPGDDAIKVTLVAANGTFHGTFIHPVDHKIRAFSGVVLQGSGFIQGFFPGIDVAGVVSINAQ
ncbi:MAG: hypothetical protein JWL59_3559 [Chthoniobacteraceae bacterium]|nr:hypothetical protein [Chthoniobacteraceae bacterium]